MSTVIRPQRARPSRTTRHGPSVLLAFVLALTLGACARLGFAPGEMDHDAVRVNLATEQPDHVTVRHCLIAVEESGMPGVSRTVEEAERLARLLLERAAAGEDFGELIRRYSDDRESDGTYRLSNYGVRSEDGEGGRTRMVRAFGDVAFDLEPDQLGLVAYDEKRSPYGFHVILRVE